MTDVNLGLPISFIRKSQKTEPWAALDLLSTCLYKAIQDIISH